MISSWALNAYNRLLALRQAEERMKQDGEEQVEG